MEVVIAKSWRKILKDEFNKSYFLNLIALIKNEYENNICFPKEENIFSALNNCKPKYLKVVILGQEPYHRIGQANGMSFSVNAGIKHPPSLVNILKELEQDIGENYPVSADLSSWSSQGVLLLNSILTVKKNEVRSHQNIGWEIFTDEIIKAISKNFNGVVFMLWGEYAKKKNKLINNNSNLILESGHPSPLSANRGNWFGNRHFSQTNDYLISICSSKNSPAKFWVIFFIQK